MSVSQSTIFALSSAAGKAGVSIIRISGQLTLDCLGQFCGKVPQPRYASLQKILDPNTGEVIDQGLVLWFPGPNSFTGEDCAEFQVHGSNAVIAKLLECLSTLNNFRMAEPGEFARRAFENGKLDLTQVEGLADLINSDTEIQRKQAVMQSSGYLAKLYTDWRYQLVESMTLLTAAIDFSDEEDIATDILKNVKPKVKHLYQQILGHTDDGHRGEILRDGYQVVLAGVPNVGKSSLLNALARREAAIVSDEAGTTRDIIQVSLDLEGFPILVMDTAGLRSTTSEVEREGIRRTIKHANDANMILWLIDAHKPSPKIPDDFAGHPNIVLVYNKIDLMEEAGLNKLDDGLHLSLKTNIGINQLIKHITSAAKTKIGSINSPVISRQRYRSDLKNCLAHLKVFLENDIEQTELRAEDLRLAANSIGRITGDIDVEDLLDHLFSEFCIGK